MRVEGFFCLLKPVCRNCQSYRGNTIFQDAFLACIFLIPGSRGLYPAKLASRKLAGRVSSQCSGSHCSKLSLFFWSLSLGNKIIATLYSMQIGGNTWRSRGNVFMAPSPKKDRRFFKAEENYLALCKRSTFFSDVFGSCIWMRWFRYKQYKLCLVINYMSFNMFYWLGVPRLWDINHQHLVTY